MQIVKKSVMGKEIFSLDLGSPFPHLEVINLFKSVSGYL